MSKHIKLFFLIAVGFVLISQFILLSFSLSKNIDNWAVIQGVDVDGSQAIRVATKTRWYNYNGFTSYGVLYFRLAHTFDKLNPFTASINVDEYSNSNAEGHHFALLIISLLSLFALSYLISSIITDIPVQRMISMIILNILFTKNQYWMTWLFRVHPDILLSFLVSLAIYLSIKYLSNNKNVLFWQSAIAWGAALTTKLSVIFYLPALLILFIPEFKKENFLKIRKYFVIISITYFAIGFPQNFFIWKHINFLISQSGYSHSPTIASFSNWWYLLFSQSWMILLAIVILSICWGRVSTEFNRTTFIKSLIITVFPFLYFLSKNITAPNEHYTLPIASGIFVLFTLGVSKYTKLIYDYLSEKIKISPYVSSISILIIGITLFRLTPNVIPDVLDKQLDCREESRKIFGLVSQYQRENYKVHIDPYVPYHDNLGNIERSWRRTFKDIRPGNADLLVLKREYYKRYILSPEESGISLGYIETMNPNWKEIKKFYNIFYNKNITTDIYGQTWIKIYSDECSWEVWKLKESSSLNE